MVKIRYNVFETNSSSVHSLIMTDEDTYKKLERGDLMISGYESNFKEEFITYEEAYAALKELFDKYPDAYSEHGIDNLDNCERDEVEEIMARENIAYSLDRYGGEEFEKYEDFYTSPSGDKIVAFGYFGRDG